MSDSIITAIATAVLVALVNVPLTIAVLRTEMKYLRRDVNAAHKRLDRINAPAAFVD